MESLSRKRILFAITKSNWGGAQVYVATLAKAAKEAGATVAVTLGSATGKAGAPGLLATKLMEDGIETIPLSSMRRDISLMREFSAFLELVRVIRKYKPDVLHVNSSKMGALGALAGRIAAVPTIIYTAHGWPHREPRNILWKLFVWVSSWLTVVLAHTVVVVSEHDRVTAPVIFSRRKIVTIPNGIKEFPLLSKEAARHELAKNNPLLSAKRTWLLMIAELHKNKGVDVAIRSLKDILPAHPEVGLVVLGEGEERDALEKQCRELHCSDDVFFLGFTESARTYLAAADTYLMPSRKEGLPIALLEAGLASLPVLATDTGGIPEVIESNHSGIVVPAGSQAVFTKELLYLLNNEEVRARFGSALYDTVLRRYTESEMVAKTLARY